MTLNKLYVKHKYAILASAIARIWHHHFVDVILYKLWRLYEGRNELTAGQTTQYLSGLPKNTDSFIYGAYQGNDDDHN